MATATKTYPSPAIQLATICQDAQLTDIAKRDRMEELTGEEVKALGKALKLLTLLGEQHPELAASCDIFRKEIARLRRRYEWECMECGSLFNHDEQMIDDEGLPTCPGCNSQDFEPN